MVDVNLFLIYFETNWIRQNSNWFEGAAPGYPSSNNALEGTNNDIKDSFTFRERLPMNEFLELLLKIVRKWAEDRDEILGHKHYYKRAPLETRLESLAYKFATSPTHMHTSDEINYYFCYDESRITCTKFDKYEKLVEKRQCNLNNIKFDDFISVKNDVCKVTMDREDWRKSTCVCEKFQKQNICTHTVGLAFRLGLAFASNDAILLSEGKKLKRGRKPTAVGGQALLVT